MVFLISVLIWENKGWADTHKDDENLEYSSEKKKDPSKPRKHFKVQDAAALDPEKVTKIYGRLADQIEAGYKISGNPVTETYKRWKKYNRYPYRSATHGRRYLNNYANALASSYEKYEKAGRLPVGSIIAKDSFSVTNDGEAMPGPFFIMEKMPKGFNYVSGDWRYTMIMPDGSIFGETKGVNADKVVFCIKCHLAAEKNDHLYFLPPAARISRNEP